MSESAPSVPNRRSARRQTPKRSTKVSCTVAAPGGGTDLEVSILDASQTGVRLVLQGLALPGQTLELTLENVMLRKPVKAAAEVVWSVPAADGRHCIGARFRRPLSYADLQVFTYT